FRLFHPVAETSTRFPIGGSSPESLQRPVSHISQDRAGMLWLATEAGLYRFDQRHGLARSAVPAILEDRYGRLWVSTAAGLSRFDPRTNTFTNYYESDGLAGSAFEGY